MFINTKKVESEGKFLIYTVEVLPEGCSNSNIVKVGYTYDKLARPRFTHEWPSCFTSDTASKRKLILLKVTRTAHDCRNTLVGKTE
ncbi:hypothetical protein OESDEN_10687 [Oesophagostomum dentatum]|uniref:Uncharacterized protein n=1 Tax=Oesophagostomum dentatum TaxID=61180 RepID=A0A0B1SZY8_OESDE|nr:hypothetical protein OESDEN_10687 [Oesophagostomum dentatum]